MNPETSLSTVAVFETAQGTPHRTVVIEGYYDRPTFIGRGSDGERQAWLVELTRPATAEEERDYWKARAQAAEVALTWERLEHERARREG